MTATRESDYSAEYLADSAPTPLGSRAREMQLVRFLRTCADWQRTNRVLLARYGVLAIRGAQKHGFIIRKGKYTHWGRPDDTYRLTREGKLAADAPMRAAAE